MCSNSLVPKAPVPKANSPAIPCPTLQILSSPTAMKRLRGAVSGRLAYVVPGTVGDEEVDLCVQVGVEVCPV